MVRDRVSEAPLQDIAPVQPLHADHADTVQFWGAHSRNGVTSELRLCAGSTTQRQTNTYSGTNADMSRVRVVTRVEGVPMFTNAGTHATYATQEAAAACPPPLYTLCIPMFVTGCADFRGSYDGSDADRNCSVFPAAR